ncbi:MAG: TRAP transporter substrate-binding protein [Thiotrichaceae bacterium]
MMARKLLLSAIICSMFAMTVTAATAATTLKLSHNHSRDHVVHQVMAEMAKKIVDQTNGEIRIRIYPDAQLGNQRESMELMQNGALDLVKSNAAELEAFGPAYSVFNLPYLFRDKAHYYQVRSGAIGTEILNSTADKGFIGLTYYDAGARSFYSNKPIIKPEDLKGMKVRVQPSPTAIAMIKSLGGNPTPLAYGELYTAMQQGVVDAAENNIPSFSLSRHSEVSKYFSIDEHTMVPDVLVISTKSLAKLTSEHQQILMTAAVESSEKMKVLWAKAEQTEQAKAEKLGVTFVSADKEAFAIAVAPMYQQIETDNPALHQMIERIKVE